MKWYSAEKVKPDTKRPVLVSDGKQSYAVGWYHEGHDHWYAALGMLRCYECLLDTTMILYQNVVEWADFKGEIKNAKS